MVATAATLGNLLFGWDSSTVAGVCVFILCCVVYMMLMALTIDLNNKTEQKCR